MSLEAIRYDKGKLTILDQLLLPHQSVYLTIKNAEDGWNAIKKMQVRGAPAIGIVGCLSLAVELTGKDFTSSEQLMEYTIEKLKYLVTARPTAVNMADAERTLSKMGKALLCTPGLTTQDIQKKMIEAMEATFPHDIEMNKKMGNLGAEHVLNHYHGNPVKILTHCNTGSLATGGYGTALGVVRALHEKNRLLHCYCTETRPYNQGARLTAYELVHDKIPSTLICDNMASMLMKERNISAVFVGADRIVSNGDTANKIGTYQLAIVAKHHCIPFYVVAPSTSCDLILETGKQIVIEERAHDELTHINGKRIAAEGIGVWNPAFDVTPADLITGGIVTEVGVFKPEEFKEKLTKALSDCHS